MDDNSSNGCSQRELQVKSTLDAALFYEKHGLSVIPIRADGSKKPRIDAWGEYQSRRALPEELAEWFSGSECGIALICGEVSEHLHVFDFDEPGLHLEFEEILASEYPGVLEKLVAVDTPRGDTRHYYCRYEPEGNPPLRNESLARRFVEGQCKVRVETRGEGGYVICPGSHPKTHRANRPYTFANGKRLDAVGKLTWAEIQCVLAVCRSFDLVGDAKAGRQGHSPQQISGGDSIGGRFNSEVSWSDILTPHGWQVCREKEGVTYWTRPGKDISDGYSATTGRRSLNDGRELFYNFSANAYPFDAGSMHDKFGAYAVLNHGGDFTAAARDLADRYGDVDTSAVEEYISGRQAEHAASQVGGDEWGDIVSFDDPILSPFPADVLPDSLREWVYAVAEETQTPVEMPAMICLAVAAASIAGKVRVEGQPGWSEPTNIFAAVVMPPSNRKSRVFDLGFAPLKEFERELVQSNRVDFENAKFDYECQENQLGECMKKLKTDPGDQETEARKRSIIAWLAENERPYKTRLWISDATPEALTQVLYEQKGRLASISPEGDVFDKMLGQYNKGLPNLDVFLKGYSGDDIRNHRVNRGTEIDIERPTLTCAYTVQPEVIRRLGSRPEVRGLGLFSRFLFAWPRSLMGSRKTRPEPVPQEVAYLYCNTIRRLLAFDGTLTLKLSDEASEIFDRWREQIERDLRPSGRMGQFIDWGGKLCGNTLRLAAILHCVEHGCGHPENPFSEFNAESSPTTIGVDSVTAAIAIGEALIPHAEFTLSSMAPISRDDASTVMDAQTVLGWIQRTRKTRFNVRQARDGSKRALQTTKRVTAALGELVDRNYLRRRDDGTQAEYVVSPDLAQAWGADS